MNILIINQHSCNHGDEAAGSALIRALIKEGHKVSVHYSIETENAEAGYFNDINGISHYGPLNGKLYYRLCKYLPLFLSIIVGYILVKDMRKFINLVLKTDLVISAPSGVNLGPYRDYGYLWKLEMIAFLKKKLIIYSISFGPLPQNDKNFTKRAIGVLKKASFLSLRDKQSQLIADNYKIKYRPSIDTAFLFEVNTEIPDEYKFLKELNYAVIIPHQLYAWHPHFKTLNKNNIDDSFLHLIKEMTKHFEKVVLLPQLFGGSKNYFRDEDYFNRISLNIKKTIVFPGEYNSDIQQQIIKFSKFVIGARYHSIIYAINNKIPFVSLSYENKMRGTLQLLDLDHLNYDINDFFDNNELIVKKIINSIQEKPSTLYERLEAASNKSKKIAKETFNNLISIIN